MITTAPLPSRILMAGPSDPGRAAAAWTRPGDRALITGRTAWSLAALATVLARRLGRSPHILLPAWICNQSLWPLRRTGARLTFLPVSPEGVGQWHLAAAADPVDMAVIVHTFGAAAGMAAARAFATAAGIPLVEDCAHALGPAPGIGEEGDMALYSPHKLLPQPDGAVLVVRPRAAAWAAELEAELALAAPAPAIGRWLCRRLVQAALPDGLRRMLPASGQPDSHSDPETMPMAGPFRASPRSLATMARIDLAAEASARRANHAALIGAVAGLAGWRPLLAEPGPAPYRLAMLCDDEAVAERVYGVLRGARLPVETWPDLPTEVRADPIHAQGALMLRRRVLLLPVHGSLSPRVLVGAYGKALS